MWGVWAPGASVPCGGGSGSAAVCGTGPHRSSQASQEASAGPGGLRVVPPGWGGGGGGPPSSMDLPRRGVVVAAAGGMGRVPVLGGVGSGGPLRRGRGGRGDTVPGTGGVAGTWGVASGGWWGMRMERSVAAIPFAGAVRARGVVARWGRVVGSGSGGGGVGTGGGGAAGGGGVGSGGVGVAGMALWTPCGFSGPPCGGGGSGIVCSPWGCTIWWAGGAGRGPGLTVTVVEESHVPRSVWPAVVVVCGGWMTGRLVTGMWTRVWTGSCLVAASAVVVAAGGRGAWVLVGGGSWLGWGSVFRRCQLGLCRCVCGVVCARVGAGLGLGSGLGLGPGSRLRRTSVRRCEGADVGSGVFPVRCGGARVACVGVGGSVRAAAALAFAVALRMRAAGRGGSEDEVEEVDEAEDEEEVVDAGWAVMRAGLRAAASTAATAGRMEGMSSGCRLGAGDWGGPVVTWRPGGPIWSAAAGEGGAGLWPSLSGLGWAAVLQCEGLCGLASTGGNSSRELHSGAGGGGPGSSGVCAGGVGGPLGGLGVPRGAGLLSAGVCGFSSVGGLRGVRRVGLWRACAGVRAGGGGPCRGARGWARYWACVGLRVSSERGGAWAGIVRWGALCRCMCPLAAARLRGQ